jgi:hypothetical protein
MKEVVSGVIAVLLLALYGYAIWSVCSSPRTTPPGPIDTVLNLVGALVSALVIAVLAITPPSGSPGRVLAASMGPSAAMAAQIVTGAYLVAWGVCGIALLITWLRVPDATPSLASAAKSWLGLAIAAAYAFLGLKP